MTSIRRYGIWILLAITLAATYWASVTQGPSNTGESGGVANVAPAHEPSTDVSAKPSYELDIDRLRRAELGKPARDLFGSDTTEIAGEGQHTVAPEVEKPIIPFTYAGKLQDEDGFIVFLSVGDKNHSVKVGDVVDQWQVRSIRPPQLVMRYLPLKYDVPLMIGEVN